MIFSEKTIFLKDGRTALLRSPIEADAEKMLEYIRKACGETDFLLRYPEEFSMAVEQERDWIIGLRQSPHTLAIACFVDGEVAGNCEINFMTALKMQHRAGIHIAILKEYWNLGMGSAMISELMAVAKADSRVEVVELELLEGNHRARALYEKYGFRIVCERPNAFKLKDGTMLKEYFMQASLL